MNKKQLQAKNCGNCKYMTQGKYSCFCGHPKAYDGYKDYTYWIMGCDQFERHPDIVKALSKL